MCQEETSDSESSCALIGQSRYSLSSVLSTDSLRGELLLPDLLIQEPEEGEEERTMDGAKEVGRPPDGRFSLLESPLYQKTRQPCWTGVFHIQ